LAGYGVVSLDNAPANLLAGPPPRRTAEELNAQPGHSVIGGYFRFLGGKIEQDKRYRGFVVLGFEIDR
jgi:hypothetical protein